MNEFRQKEMLIVIEQADDYVKEERSLLEMQKIVESLINMVQQVILGEIIEIKSKMIIVSHAKIPFIIQNSVYF